MSECKDCEHCKERIQKLEAHIKELTHASAELAIPALVLIGQDNYQPYAEISRGLMEEFRRTEEQLRSLWGKVI